MEYTIRTLTAEDVFPVVNIISKIGVLEIKKSLNGKAIHSLIKSAKKEMDADANDADVKNDIILEEVGASIFFDFVEIILKNLGKCKEEIFEFVSSVTSISVNELKAISPAEFMEMVIDIFKKDEFKDFMKVVLKFVK